MSWLSNLIHGKPPTEADVVGYIKNLHDDADAAYTWLATNGPAIAADAKIIVAVLAEFGAGDPRIALAVAAINAFTVALNAVVAAKATGEGIYGAVTDAYKALKGAQAASAQAALAVVK